MAVIEMPKARGELLEFGKRAGIRNLTPAEESAFWHGDFDVIFRKEKECIETKIKNKAEDIVMHCKQSGKKSINKDEIENEYTKEIEHVIKNNYCEYRTIKSLVDRYQKFIEETQTKSYSLGKTFMILLIISIIIEFIVLLFQSVGMALTEGEDLDATVIGMAFFYAVLLAIGGYILGVGIGRWLVSNKFKKLGMAHEEITYKMQTLDYIFIVIGSVLILAISIIRTIAGGGLQAFFITLLLGIVVAIFKSQHEFNNSMRGFIAILREKYSIYLASKKHMDNLNNYKETFLTHLQNLAKKENIEIQSKEG